MQSLDTLTNRPMSILVLPKSTYAGGGSTFLDIMPVVTATISGMFIGHRQESLWHIISLAFRPFSKDGFHFELS